MRLSFSSFYFSVVAAAAAATTGSETVFFLEAKNGVIPSSSSRRSLQKKKTKGSKKAGPVPSPAPTSSPSASESANPTQMPTVNPLFTVDCTDGGISDHTASLYDEYPPPDFDYTQIAGKGVFALVPNGLDGYIVQKRGTAPRACMDDIINYCARLCESSSECTAFNAAVLTETYYPNPFDELGGVTIQCDLENSIVPNLPLRVINKESYVQYAATVTFALKTAQAVQPLVPFIPSDAADGFGNFNLESPWVAPSLQCIATKSYTDFSATPEEQQLRVFQCTNCLERPLNELIYPGPSCIDIARSVCDDTGIGVMYTCASECFFDVGGPNDEICRDTVRVTYLAINGSPASNCVNYDVYDSSKGYKLAPYTCPFMNLPAANSTYPYFPPVLPSF